MWTWSGRSSVYQVVRSGPSELELSNQWAGYAGSVSSLIPLSVTGAVLITACLVLAAVALVGIVVLWRGNRGE